MVLSAVLGKYSDLVVVSALLVINAVLSFMQERRAAGVVEALRRRLQVNARVRRDSSWQVIPARELVPGDIVRVRPGDIIPADVKVLTGALTVDQSALTGALAACGPSVAPELVSWRSNAPPVATLACRNAGHAPDPPFQPRCGNEFQLRLFVLVLGPTVRHLSSRAGPRTARFGDRSFRLPEVSSPRPTAAPAVPGICGVVHTFAGSRPAGDREKTLHQHDDDPGPHSGTPSMISPNELSERLSHADQPIVLDVRSASELQGPLGRLEGAVNIPVDELSNHLEDLRGHRARLLVPV